MTNSEMTVTEFETKKTGVETGDGKMEVVKDHETFNRRFGLMDLWTIRRKGRKFKIHNRISRM